MIKTLLITCSLALPVLGCQPVVVVDEAHDCEGRERIAVIDSSYDNDRVLQILSALTAWESVMQGQIKLRAEMSDFPEEPRRCAYRYINQDDGPDQVAKAEGYINHTGAGTATGEAYLPNNLSVYEDDINPASDAEFRITVIHETGHMLGLEHLYFEDHISVMESSYKENMELTEEEGMAAIKLWHE